LCPANVRAEFVLEGFETLLLIHHTHIIKEPYEPCKL
jgi:hypothetical protein